MKILSAICKFLVQNQNLQLDPLVIQCFIIFIQGQKLFEKYGLQSCNKNKISNYQVYREKYLNIYVVKAIARGGAAAYTFLPGTAPPVMDAIVSLDDYVGKIGTSSPGRSRTLTHEVGH